MNNTKAYLYDAFISYRHLDHDMAVAQRLQKLLEAYRPPRSSAAGRRKIRVFRDKSDLPVSADLGQDIRDALAASRFLVVVCSPELSSSRWCMEEINYFKQLHGGSTKNILVLLIRGEPHESFPKEICTDLRLEALPDGRQQYVSVDREPLAASIVADTPKKSLRFLKGEFLRIAAPILGCRYDDLFRRQRRRVLRRATAGTAAALILLCGAFFLTLNSIQAQNAARMAEERADASLRQSYSLQSTRELSGGDRLAALRLVLRAVPESGELEPVTFGALFSALYSSGHEQTLLRHSVRMSELLFTPDGELIVSLTENQIHLWETKTGQQRMVLRDHEMAVTSLAISPDGRYLAALSPDTLTVYELEDGSLKLRQNDAYSFSSQLYFSPNGDTLYIDSHYDNVQGYPVNGGETALLESPGYYMTTPRHGPAAGLSLFAGQSYLRLVDNSLKVTAEYELPMQVADYGGTVRAALSPSGESLIVYSDEALLLCRIEDGTFTIMPRIFEYGFLSACFLSDGRIAASCSDNVIRIYNGELTGLTLSLYGHTGLTYLLRAPAEGGLLLTGSHDGTVKIWETTFGGLLGDIPFENAVRHLEISPDGQSFVTANTNIARLCRLEKNNYTAFLPFPAEYGYPTGAWFDADDRPVLMGNFAQTTAYSYNISTREIVDEEPIQPDEMGYDPGAWRNDRRFRVQDSLDSLVIRDTGVRFSFDAEIVSINLSSDDTMAVVACADNRVYLYATAQEDPLLIINGSQYPVFDVDFSPAGDILYGTAWDGTVTLWDVKTGAVLAERYGMRNLYTQMSDFEYYSDMTGAFLNRFQIPGLIEYVYPARMSHDGKLLMCPTAGGVLLYDISGEGMLTLARELTTN